MLLQDGLGDSQVVDQSVSHGRRGQGEGDRHRDGKEKDDTVEPVEPVPVGEAATDCKRMAGYRAGEFSDPAGSSQENDSKQNPWENGVDASQEGQQGSCGGNHKKPQRSAENESFFWNGK